MARTSSWVISSLVVVSLAVPSAEAQTRRRRGPRAPLSGASAGSPGSPTSGSSTPGPTVTGSAVAQIAVAGDHSCARMVDGRVLCWGNDVILTLLAPRSSILGPRVVPTPLPRAHDATDLVMQGSQPVVRVGTDRLVSWSWDIERLGQRAHSPEDWQTDALEVASVPPLRLIASASGSAVCAIDPQGAMRCRGSNQYGQLGADSALDATEEWLPVAGLGAVTEASHGGNTGCAITTDGAVWCFGQDFYGTLGDGGAATEARRPSRVLGLPPASHIAVSRAGHACALSTTGTVHCWGRGREGQLGNGAAADTSTPAQVTGLSGATQLTVGRYTSCALASGRVWCWGAGNEGQLGHGASVGSTVPVEVTDLDRVTQLAAGDAHVCALRDDASVWCWGRNAEGSCGMAGGANVLSPARVSLDTATR